MPAGSAANPCPERSDRLTGIRRLRPNPAKIFVLHIRRVPRAAAAQFSFSRHGAILPRFPRPRSDLALALGPSHGAAAYGGGWRVGPDAGVVFFIAPNIISETNRIQH